MLDSRKILRGTTMALLCLFVLALASAPVAAQTAPTPITIGAEQAGEVSPANIAPSFVYTASAAESVGVTVRAVTPGFAASLRVLNAAGALIDNVPNETGAAELDAVIELSQAGQYIFQVTTANGFGGQFTILLGEAQAPVETLVLGTPLDSSVDINTPQHRYQFDAPLDQVLLLSIDAPAPSDAIVTVSTDSGVDLASVLLRLTSIRFDIPAGSGRYLVTVTHSGGTLAESYRISLRARAQDNGAQAEPTEVPQQEPTRVQVQPLPASGPCVVASGDGGRVNLRSAPSTTTDNVVSQLSGNQTAQVTGRLGDNSWLQVSITGGSAWVATFVVRQGGDCSAVPVVNAPGQPAATAVPQGNGQPGTIDLIIAGVTLTPQNPFEDNDFAVNVTIANQGGDAANNVVVALDFDPDGFDINNETSQATIPSIPGNSAVTLNFTGMRANDHGEVDTTVLVDPNNAVGETNEGNNSNSFSFNVLADLPDLVVSGLEVETDDDNTEVKVRVQVTNSGSQESNDFQVALDFDPPNVGQQIIDFDDLNEGESDTKTVTVDLGDEGDYRVNAQVDINNSTDEAREDNNSRRRDFEINN